MIYLRAEVVSGLGEDTFWTWAKREFPESSFDTPVNVTNDDIILQYSTLGASGFKRNTVALCWELYPEMKDKLQSNEWDAKINSIGVCAQSSGYRVVATPLMIPAYEKYGNVDVLPIGVDTDIFKPLPKEEMRLKYNIPRNKMVGFWGGTTHRMKGYTKVLQYSKDNPNIHWIIVWKHGSEASHMEGASNFTLVPQQQLAELMSCADFFLSCGMLRPFYMIEWEAMACNLKAVILNDMQKDFVPSDNPRKDVIRLGWDRKTARETWLKYIESIKETNRRA